MEGDYSVLKDEALTHFIKVPGSPFAEIVTRLGRDEIYGAVVGALGTAGIDLLLHTLAEGKVSKGLAVASILGAGIVGQKIGIYFPYVKEAFSTYHQVPVDRQPSFLRHLVRTAAKGNHSMLENLLVGDLIYAGLMYKELQLFPQTPAFFLALPTLFTEVLAVAGIEIGLKELLYNRYQRKLQKAGFQKEQYFQAQFPIDTTKNPKVLLEELVIKFGEIFDDTDTPSHTTGATEEIIEDHYFSDPSIRHYNGRKPQVRLRKVTTRGEMDERIQRTLQVFFTRVRELDFHDPREFHYYLTRVRKFSLPCGSDEQQLSSGGSDGYLPPFLRRAIKVGDYTDVRLDRISVYNPQTLSISVDNVVEEKPFLELTLRVYEDVALLREVMDHIMSTYKVLQTTRTMEALVARHRARQRERILPPLRVFRGKRTKKNGPAGTSPPHA